MLIDYILVFIAAAIPWFEVALVVPLGIIRGLSPFWVMLIAFIGNLITVLPIIIGFEKAKIWYQKRREKKEKPPSKRNERGKQIWNKYGLPGLAMLGPILTGIHVAAFLAMTLGAKKTNTIIWITVSLGVWTVVFGLATVFGLDIFIR